MKVNQAPITIRAKCRRCREYALHRCVLVRMVGRKNIVESICLRCGRSITR